MDHEQQPGRARDRRPSRSNSSTSGSTSTTSTVGQLAVVLQLVAERLWEVADASGMGSSLHSTGLGAFLAASQATELVPAGETVPDPTEPAAGVLRLLELVEELLAELDPRLEGASELVLTVAEVLREARADVAA